MIESLESRVLLSAAAAHHITADDVAPGSIYPSVSSISAGLSAVVGGTLRGRIDVNLANQSSIAQKGLVVLDIYASDNGQFNSGDPLVATVNRQVNLAAGSFVQVGVPINKILPATLGVGNDTLILQATDPAGNSQVNLAGGSFTYAEPQYLLSEKFGKAPPPVALVSSTKTNLAVQLQISDNGNVPLAARTSVSIYLSPDQTVGSGTLVTKVTPRLNIGAGRAAEVNVPLQSIPPLADGDYYFVADVTDPLGQVTTVASSSRAVVSAPFVSLSETFSGSSLGTSLVSGTRTRSAATLLVKNAGNIVPPGPVKIDLFASTNHSIVGATKINSVTIPLKVAPGSSRLVRVPLGSVPALGAGNYFIVAQVTNPIGGTSLASSASTLSVAAPFISLSPTVASLPSSTSIIAGAKLNSFATLLIKNNGNVPTLRVAVTLLGSSNGQLGGATAFNTVKSAMMIPPGATRPLRAPLTGLSTLANGSYYIVAEVTDSNGGVSVAASTVAFKVAAPFVALSATIDSALSPLALSGEGLVDFTVTNQGNIAAGDPAGGQDFHIVLDLLGQNGLADSLGASSFTQRLVIAPGDSKKMFAGFSPTAITTPLQAGVYIPRLTVSIVGTNISTTVTGTSFPITVT